MHILKLETIIHWRPYTIKRKYMDLVQTNNFNQAGLSFFFHKLGEF